ncbi:MAG TPA: SipW-dependent-type signal peptide-containing protein [Candidatus Lumbricidophila sp.]|nr:SipW-dependent-type signal peptide-containing protein [Candidatus Lumbricidophila sp.]
MPLSNQIETTPAHIADEPRKGSRRRKVAAILAGGIVLGVGAAYTLAAWNDSEFATGTFGAGTFDLQGSLDGSAFSSDTAAPGKSLTFALNADRLEPSAVVYSPFAIKLSAASNYQANITLSQAAADTTGTISTHLTYSVYEVASWNATCSAANPPSTALVTNRAATAAGSVALTSLAAVDAPKYLCIVVTADSGLPQGSAGTITWDFTGTATTPL